MPRFNKKSPKSASSKRLRSALVVGGVLLLLVSAFNLFCVLQGGWGSLPGISSGGEPEVSPSDPVPLTNWSGWQKGVVAARSADLISEADGSVIRSLEQGCEVVVLERREKLAFCRVGLDFGWLSVSELELSGEPFLASGAAAQPVELSGADKEFLDSVFADYGCVGANVAVIKGGELSYVYAYGWCDPYLKTQCTPQTKFRVASVSKLFVAASAAALAEQGVVDLDEDISVYIGSEVRSPYFPEEKITLRQLLTHTSSLDAFSITGSGKKQLLNWLGTKGIWRKNKTPGTVEAWQYSNGGIGIAAATLELASGHTLIEYTNEYFFSPLGADASFIGKFIKDQDNIAPCYKGKDMVQSASVLINKKYSETPGDNFSFYAGGLVISAEDLAKFTCILANDGYYNGVYYMSPESVELLETAHFELEAYTQCLTLRYCEDMVSGRDLYYHTGSSTGVVSILSYDPATGDGVAVVVNGSRRRDQRSNGISLVCEEVAGYCYDNLCA